MSKFCAKCGTELPDEAVVCSNCGAPVGGQATQPEAQPTAGAPVQPNPAAAVFGNVGDTVTDTINKVKSDKKLLGIVAGAVAALLVVIIVLCVALSGGGYKSAIDNYIDVAIRGKVNKIEKLAPKAYWQYLEDEMDVDIDDIKDEYKDNYDDIMDSLEDEYGKNVKVSYKVTDKDELSDKKLKNIQEGLKDNYDIPKKSVTKGYKVDVDMTIKGKDDEDTDESTLYIVKIKGDWYICSQNGKFDLSFY